MLGVLEDCFAAPCCTDWLVLLLECVFELLFDCELFELLELLEPVFVFPLFVLLCVVLPPPFPLLLLLLLFPKLLLLSIGLVVFGRLLLELFINGFVVVGMAVVGSTEVSVS